MTKTLSSKAPREPKFDATLIVGVILCALLAGVFAYWRMGPGRPITANDFKFPTLEIDREKLEAQRQRKYARANLQEVQSEWQQLIAAARSANRLQFGEAAREEQLTANAEAKVWANEVIVGSGLEGFVVTGEPVFRDCQAGLDELLGALRAGTISLEEAKTNPPDATFGTYRTNCGNLLPLLIEHGLVTEDGSWSSADASLIVDVLSRYRWAHIIHDQKAPWAQLTREGARIFARWRVEQARGYSLAERRQFLDKLATQFPDYNTDFAAGVLAFRAGEFGAALRHFERLARAHPRSDFEKYAEFLRERVRSGDNAAPNEAS